MNISQGKKEGRETTGTLSQRGKKRRAQCSSGGGGGRIHPRRSQVGGWGRAELMGGKKESHYVDSKVKKKKESFI